MTLLKTPLPLKASLLSIKSESCKSKFNLKRLSALSIFSGLIAFSIAQNVTAQLSRNENNDILDLMLPILASIKSQCTSPQALTIINATDDGNFDDNFGPGNAIDGNPNETSRWSSLSNTITFELATNSAVTDLSISWFRSESRRAFFEIEGSLDNTNWQTILSNGQSSRTNVSGEFQSHDVTDVTARYIRIIGSGNESNDFNSVTEVIINGCNRPLSIDSSSTSSSSSSSTSSSSGSSTSSSSSTSSGSSTSSTSSSSSTSTSSTSSSGGADPIFGLDPSLEPWENFDLVDWVLDTPADNATRRNSNRPFNAENGSLVPDGLSDRTQDFDFAAGNLVPGSEPFFFTGEDGGMVFKSTIAGFRTSLGTNFVRSELREMLRRGNTRIGTQGANQNNWVLGYQPNNSNNVNIGGRNGKLTATLRVNQVTSTGDAGQVGRVIIGQIHASDDEPIRLYYRKLPFNELGGIYFAHELHASLGPSDDILVDMIGQNGRSAPNPENGIALGELFSYEIINRGADLEVIIRRGDQDGEEIASTIFDMSQSGYDNVAANEWMYFKAGAYSQNNSGDADDFDMVTFYRLNNTHD